MTTSTGTSHWSSALLVLRRQTSALKAKQVEIAAQVEANFSAIQAAFVAIGQCKAETAELRARLAKVEAVPNIKNHLG